MRELIAVARELAERDDVDAVILTGAARFFSAGADLDDARAWADASLSISERRRITATGYRLCRASEEIPQVTIAAASEESQAARRAALRRNRPGSGPGGEGS